MFYFFTSLGFGLGSRLFALRLVFLLSTLQHFFLYIFLLRCRISSVSCSCYALTFRDIFLLRCNSSSYRSFCYALTFIYIFLPMLTPCYLMSMLGCGAEGASNHFGTVSLRCVKNMTAKSLKQWLWWHKCDHMLAKRPKSPFFGNHYSVLSPCFNIKFM